MMINFDFTFILFMENMYRWLKRLPFSWIRVVLTTIVLFSHPEQTLPHKVRFFINSKVLFKYYILITSRILKPRSRIIVYLTGMVSGKQRGKTQNNADQRQSTPINAVLMLVLCWFCAGFALAGNESQNCERCLCAVLALCLRCVCAVFALPSQWEHCQCFFFLI